MGKSVRHRVESKLEYPLWEAEDGSGPVLGRPALELPHSQPLNWKASGVSQSGGGVFGLDLGLDMRPLSSWEPRGPPSLPPPPPGKARTKHTEVETHGG